MTHFSVKSFISDPCPSRFVLCCEFRVDQSQLPLCKYNLLTSGSVELDSPARIKIRIKKSVIKSLKQRCPKIFQPKGQNNNNKKKIKQWADWRLTACAVEEDTVFMCYVYNGLSFTKPRLAILCDIDLCARMTFWSKCTTLKSF